MIAFGFVKSCILSTCGHHFYMIFLLPQNRMNSQSEPWYKYVILRLLRLLLLLQNEEIKNGLGIKEMKKKKIWWWPSKYEPEIPVPSPMSRKEDARVIIFLSVTQRHCIRFIIWKALIFENTFGNLHSCLEMHACDLAAARKRLGKKMEFSVKS